MRVSENVTAKALAVAVSLVCVSKGERGAWLVRSAVLRLCPHFVCPICAP